MKYNSKLPKNGKGYTVANRLFETLRLAEAYCEQCNFDVNEMIMHNIEDSCEIAMSQRSTCEVLEEQLQNAIDIQQENFDKLIAERDRLIAFQGRLPLGDKETNARYLEVSIGTLKGLYQSLNIIRTMSTSSMEILHYNRYKTVSGCHSLTQEVIPCQS